jgi:hypothetical protein
VRSIDLHQVRDIRGSRHNGFEELCCQLAADDPPASGARPIRNGSPDGGVEGYWILPGDEEHGIQAKFFFDLQATQWKQLDDSVRTALEKHSNLKSYTICLPIDLPDARVKGQKSLRQKWDEHVAKWEERARQRGMAVTFPFWGQHEILMRLASDRHAGRRLFFFNTTEFSASWFNRHLHEVLAGAGPRYNSAFNVELPVASRFDSLGYTPAFRERIARGRRVISLSLSKAVHSLERLQTIPDLGTALEGLRRNGGSLLDRLAEFGDAPPPGELQGRIDEAIRGVLAAAAELSECLYRAPSPEPSSPATTEGQASETPRRFEYERHSLAKLRGAVEDLGDLVETSSAELSGRPALLLTGDAGSGKTHLLCDIASHRIAAGQPTIVILGQQLGRGDVWTQIIQRLGLACTRDELLGALDAMAESAGARALIFIDAINEAPEVGWLDELPAIIEVLSRHPWIGIAVSCRTTYVPLLVREDVVRERMSCIEHEGFAPRLFEAITAFCDHYGIETLNTPPLNPEFENPLFLKLFCEGLSNRGLKRPPSGHHGMQRIFLFLIDSVNEKLSRPSELDYPADDPVVRRAVDALADVMVESRQYVVPRSVAQETLERVLSRPGLGYSKSLLARLIAEGILADDQYYPERGEPPQAIIRFGYERLADYQIASRLLERHLESTETLEAFRVDEPLGRIFADKARAHRLSGLLSAFIVLVPERLHEELATVMPHVSEWDAYKDAFLEALPWREGRHITTRAVQYVEELLDSGRYDSASYSASDRVLESLIQLAAQPGHPLNAQWLHRRLLAVPMPERDLRWSTFLHRSRKDRSWNKPTVIERLLDWAWPDDAEDNDPCAGFDDEVVYLGATTVAWCLTTPNRFIRDRATKALVSILARRIGLVRDLLVEFRSVDDPYVAERLYAVAYGCVMRSDDRGAVELLASTVYDLVFAEGNPPPHLLLRDYARGVIERALAIGCKFELEVGKIRPPYRSEPPPLQAPSWDEIHERYDEQGYVGLLLSLGPVFGDFARYVMGNDSQGLHTWDAEPDPFEEVRRIDARLSELPDHLASEWRRVKYQDISKMFQFRVGPPMEGEELDEAEAMPDDQPYGDAVESGDDTGASEIERFLASLTPRERQLIEEYESIEARKEKALGQAREAMAQMHGDPNFPCRWVFTRVIELGWTLERFAAFDGEVNRNNMREDHKAERIGKKYQWIAYHELAARITDHRPFQHDYYSESYHYEGPWQRYFRDIDPSFLVKRSHLDRIGNCWWIPSKDPLAGLGPVADREWLMDTTSLPDFARVFVLSRPSDSTTWYPLHASGEWEEPEPEDGGRRQRRITFTLNAFLVRDSDLPLVIEAVRGGEWTGMDLSTPDYHHLFLGEYHWAPSFRELVDEGCAELSDPHNPSSVQRHWFRGMQTAAAHSVMRYSHEGRGFDCSLSESVSGHTPSVWLAIRMGLSWCRVKFRFSDPCGRVVAFDPSHEEPGPGALLVEQATFRRFLVTHRLSVIWLLIGEKLLSGDELDGPRDREVPRISVFRQVFRLGQDMVEQVEKTICLLGDKPATY